MPVHVEPVPMLLVAPAHMRQAYTTDSAVRTDGVRAMTVSTKCCVPGCGNDRAPDFPPRFGDGPCVDHLSLALPQSRRLLSSSARRLASLQRSWDDKKIFDAIVVRGRYLAFCSLLECAHDRLDRAWKRIRSEILAAASDADLASPSIAPIADQSEHRLDPTPAALDRKARTSPAPQE
jgi:hypothetical protein